MSDVAIERSIVATTDQSQSGVAGRYARALFDLATENKAVADVAKGLSSFQSLFDQSEDLQRLMRSPVFKSEDQTAAVEALAAKVGIKGLALNFLKVMGANRRLAAVPGAISAFHAMVAAAKGETTAEVTSAEKLSAKQLADVKAALKAATGSDVAVDAKVDPAILGGLIVKVGSRMMDNSLRTKLNSLKAAMKGTQ
jgi:F-type H+-transporting ATPase subunit delta